jgi:hypothetical protein
MIDLSKQPLDLLTGEGFGQGASAPHEMTRLDRIAPDELLVQAKVKKMLHRIEPPVDGRPRAAVLMLPLHKLVDVAKGDLGQGPGRLAKEEAEIESITRDGVRRELPALQVRPKLVDGGPTDVVHGLSPL